MNLGIVAAFGYGILSLVGGIIGYIQAKSKVSLLSGSISGLLLIFSAYCQLQGQTWGLTEEDAESGRRGDAESRLCPTFDANGFKPPTTSRGEEKRHSLLESLGFRHGV
ncbi:TMEM14 family protein [Trichormus sp. NMC-1]|jgi:Transmembrane proteins 14C|uniref:TMEM14 family protein n=1 Tax=Trichormus sp. NMC-1 TaxID=1853259 RepID=UPI0008DC0D0B|nr:TMEM14 family protein [Trichormus sp. NMC-1]